MEAEYKQPNNVWKTGLRIVLFVLILAILLTGAEKILVRTHEDSPEGNIGGFYELEENTLDAVFIGSSRVYAFFMPTLAFERSGICVWNLASSYQPVEAARYLIEEALKTQRDPLFIVNLEDIRTEGRETMHYLTDPMPFSSVKARLILERCRKRGVGELETFEYFFPLIRFHSRWQELTERDFSSYDEKYPYMSSSFYDDFLYVGWDYSEKFATETGSEEEPEPDAYMKRVIDGIIDYCADQGVRLLFTVTPQVVSSREKLLNRSSMYTYAESRGATVLNLQQLAETYGLDPAHDFYNPKHTNVHGAMKVTAYLTDYLTEHYGFTDKRGDKAYEKWTEAAERYDEKLASALLPFERAPRTDLPAAKLSLELLKEGGVSIACTPVEGADGYELYRKTEKTAPWEKLPDPVDERYIDMEGKTGYYYLYMPYKETDNVRYYGKVNYRGVMVK